jgi:hypothetical protein
MVLADEGEEDTMIALPYSLVIEATEDPDFFGFYSAELEGSTGVGHSIEDCLYQARWSMDGLTRISNATNPLCREP